MSTKARIGIARLALIGALLLLSIAGLATPVRPAGPAASPPATSATGAHRVISSESSPTAVSQRSFGGEVEAEDESFDGGEVEGGFD